MTPVTTTGNLKRPTTMEEIAERARNFKSEEGYRLGLAFQPWPSDVLISPFAKCGTTWTQQIVHGLRTRGDMSFDEITAVVPWIEMAHDLGLNLDAPQPAPRAFKSHLTWQKIPKGGRYLIPIRKPEDALLSSYSFFEGWWFEPGSIPLATFARERFIGTRYYWQHLASWWEVRDNPNVLILCYEDLKEDLSQAVRLIAHFIGCELDPELLEIVVRQSSLPFMLEHKRHFDDHLVRNARDPICGLPLGGQTSKVTNAGITKTRPKLPPETMAALEEVWQEEITSQFDLANYQALREEVTQRNRTRFP